MSTPRPKAVVPYFTDGLGANDPPNPAKLSSADAAQGHAREDRRTRLEGPMKGQSLRFLKVATFVGFALLLVLPIWSVKYPPLTDYPNHLARAFILHHLNDPSYQFGRYYAADWGPNPYFLADFLTQVFQRFVGIYAAGRLLLTLCILSLPLSVAFFLRRANRGSEYLSLWAFVVAYNPNFLMGFMSFELSISLCFVVVGVWLDYMHTNQEKYWLLTLVLTTLLFLTHLGGFAMAGVILLLYTVLISGFGRRLLKTVLVFSPGAVLFLHAKLHGWTGRGLDYSGWAAIAKLHTMLVPFQEYTLAVKYITILGILITVAYFLWRRKYLRIQYVWIAVVVAIVTVHWIVPPKMYGDVAFIDYRFCIFAFLCSLAIPDFRGPRTLPIVLATAIFVIHIFQTGFYFASEQTHLSNIAKTFQYIPPNSLVLAYTAKGSVSWEKSDDLHFWGYGVIERGWITPRLFHQRALQPLQLRVPMYSDDDPLGEKLLKGEYTIDLVGKNYEYVWASNVSYLDPYLEKIADPLVSQGNLWIFRSKSFSGHPNSSTEDHLKTGYE